MSDRVKGFVITLDTDYHQEDAEKIADAIRMLRGVVSVVPSIGSVDDAINRARINAQWRDKLLALIEESTRH